MNESTAADALKYAAAILRERVWWTTDAIYGSECNIDHDTELYAISDVCHQISSIAAQFGDPLRYSDGRPVVSRTEIQPGLTVEHVWEPDPAREQPLSWRGSLPSDPDVPSPGVYEVTGDPQTQKIHVQIVRM
jgi:hypothetical protein